jgi:hypothetical protein
MVRYTEAVNKQVQEKKQLDNIDKAIPEAEQKVRDSIN